MKALKKVLFATLICSSCFVLGALFADEISKINSDDVHHAQRFMGIEFSQTEIDSMLPLLNEQKKNISVMRKISLPNNVPLSYVFNPIPLGKIINKIQPSFSTLGYDKTILPRNPNDLAYYSIGQLAWLLKSKQITSVQLTEFFIARLHKYAPMLNCVITYTDSLAMQQARKADIDITEGRYLGMLHGIPYGIKDMFATKNYPTTYGTSPYRNQMIREDATVVKKLEDAGAVLIAKLSLGELAMDDKWFGGQTRNPWNTAKGSSGSSAGPASSVSAGLLPFAIGSETWGSIVSPATICGVTGLRPSFGQVSRYGAMALSWTMDKVGPLCRNVEDCAIVFNSIRGVDGKDQAMIDAPFNYPPTIDLKGMKIGFFKEDFEKDTIVNEPYSNAAFEQLKKMGAQLVPIELPSLPVKDMSLLLVCEAASAFDELTLSNTDDMMAQQSINSWPNIFRAAHFIPATEYIRANRLRWLLIQQMEAVMKKVDICIAPSLGGDNLLVTNLTGHPSVVVPNGFIDVKTPTSMVFIGQLFEEGKLLAVAKMYQDSTAFHLKHPHLEAK